MLTQFPFLQVLREAELLPTNIMSILNIFSLDSIKNEKLKLFSPDDYTSVKIDVLILFPLEGSQ